MNFNHLTDEEFLRYTYPQTEWEKSACIRLQALLDTEEELEEQIEKLEASIEKYKAEVDTLKNNLGITQEALDNANADKQYQTDRIAEVIEAAEDLLTALEDDGSGTYSPEQLARTLTDIIKEYKNETCI